MTDTFKKTQLFRFDQMAVQVKDKVEPEEADVDRYVGLEHLDPRSLKIRRWGKPSDVESSKILFQSGDIIFGKRRAYQRKLAVADFDGICSAHAMVLRPKTDVVLEEFLPSFMKSDIFMDRAVKISVGGLSPTINWKDLAKEEFALPSMDEQRQISKLLLAAGDSVSCLLELIDTAKAARRAMSTAVFNRIVSAGSSSGQCLGEIFSHIVDRGHEDLPILSVTIDGCVVRREALDRHVSDDTGNAKYLRALPGDLAYNTMRLWQGSVGIVREAGLISPAYTVLRVLDDSYAPEFLLEMLRSPAMQRVYRRYVTGVASDRWRLYFKDLSKIRVSLPLGDQIARILSDLNDIDQAEKSIHSRLITADDTLAAARRRSLGT